MDCSRRRVLACIACASDRCNAIDTLRGNHVQNKLIEGIDPAHSLDADVAHSTKNRSELSDNALYVSRKKGTNFVVTARSRYIRRVSFLRFASVAATRSFLAARSTKSRRVGSATIMSTKVWPIAASEITMSTRPPRLLGADEGRKPVRSRFACWRDSRMMW